MAKPVRAACQSINGLHGTLPGSEIQEMISENPELDTLYTLIPLEIMEMRYKILRSQDYQDSIGEMSVRNPCTPEFHLFQCFQFFRDALLLSTLSDASGPSKFIHPPNAAASAALSICAFDFSSGRTCTSQRCQTICYIYIIPFANLSITDM